MPSTAWGAPERALAYPPPWSRRLAGFLALARISNSPTVVSDALAGAALAGATEPSATIVVLAAALVLFYTAGMYLNDLCDYAIDCRERPERPLPSGLISRGEAAAGVVMLFGLGSALLWLVGPAPFVAGLALILIIVVYDAWHKTNPLSPLVMAACRLMVYVTAFVAFASSISLAFAASAALLASYLVGLTYLAKQERSPTLARYWPLAALFLPVLYFPFQRPLTLLLPLLALFALWVALSVRLVYRRAGRDVGGAIGRLIAGISLFDSLVLAASGALVGVLVALAAFGATRFLQRYIRGT